MLGFPDFFGSGFFAFCLMISSNFYLHLYKNVLINGEILSWWLSGLLSWLWCSLSWSLLNSFFSSFLFLFLLLTIGSFKSKFLQSFFKFSQLILLFIFWLFLLCLLFLNWLWLSFFDCWSLFLLFAFIISEIEWVFHSVKVESLLFEFLRLETSLNSFHITETSSKVLLWVKWLDFWFLLLLFGFSLVLSFSFFLSWFLSLLFVFMIRLLFFRFWIFFIAGDISPKSL